LEMPRTSPGRARRPRQQLENISCLYLREKVEQPACTVLRRTGARMYRARIAETSQLFVKKA
jgi:hypothetical protein